MLFFDWLIGAGLRRMYVFTSGTTRFVGEAFYQRKPLNTRRSISFYLIAVQRAGISTNVENPSVTIIE